MCRFGDFELDRRTLELRKAGQKIRLAPQPARVLVMLANRPGELVTRDELRREVWGVETHVDFERNLNYCLNCVRGALDDTARSPRYIETLPRRGYRFIAPVERERAFPEPTLAVLPFVNLNGDPAREYFAEGITDALFLSCVGRYSESVSEAEYGLQLNPTALLPNQAAAWNYLYAGRHELAEAQARRTIASFPDSLQPHFVLGWAAWCQGNTEEAIAALEKAIGLSREALSLAFLGHVYARLARRDDALRLLRELNRLASRGQASPIALVVLHAGLGDTNAAFEWLDTACRLRVDLHWLVVKFPGLDPLRSDPRSAALLHRVGIVL